METVSCTGEVRAKAEDVWRYVRDFCKAWHPAIDQMERREAGQLRAFWVHGEDTLYQERLTWFSDSDMEMRYSHLQGIAAAQRYDATLRVTPAGSDVSTVTMTAEIEAEAARALEIANGTGAIFDVGLAALAGTKFGKPVRPAPLAAVGIENTMLAGKPGLAITRTPAKDGPLCIFLHGIGGNRSNWDAQLGPAGNLIRCAALDLRGYGDSTLGTAPSTLQSYFDDILRVRQRFQADKIILCGLSYGAWIATAFAECYPNLMAGLVLTGGCTGMSEASEDIRQGFRASREGPLNQGLTPADFAQDVISAIAGPHATPEVKEALTASMAAIPAETYRDALQCFTNPPGQFDFARLTMPVLMMTGQHDALAPPDEIKSVATRIFDAADTPDVRFEQIACAGHVCNVEDPDAFNGPLLEFLSRFAK